VHIQDNKFSADQGLEKNGRCSKLRSWWGFCVTCEPESIRNTVKSQTGSGSWSRMLS
jgi:hypothetical protein